MAISPTDLILNANGSVYHLNLLPHQIAENVIVVGDPDRVPLVSKYFDKIDFKVGKREFITHTGVLNNKPISVISSGIGTDNVEILMNELDALVNIDLNKLEPIVSHKSLNIIRIGTSGSISKVAPVDSFVFSNTALGMDALNEFYNAQQSNVEKAISEKFKQYLNLNTLPYLKATPMLFDKFLKIKSIEFIKGNTLTCQGFYAPQGRTLRYNHAINNYFEKIVQFKDNTYSFTNLEMETSGYYLLADILGHKCVSLSAILANRITNQFSKNAELQIDRLIKAVLFEYL